jgi:hypothetical protein
MRADACLAARSYSFLFAANLLIKRLAIDRRVRAMSDQLINVPRISIRVLRGSRNRGRTPYKSTVLVGHSAGGLIIRETINLIVNAFEQDKNAGGSGLSTGQMMVLQSKVRFFAPAHRGLLGAGLVGLAEHLPAIDVLHALCLQWNRLYKAIERGTVVGDIMRETEKFWLAYKFPALNTLSVFGSKESVVITGKYDHEIKELMKLNQSHTTICKPRPGFMDPRDFVTDVI